MAKKLMLRVSERNENLVLLPVQIYMDGEYQDVGEAMIEPGKRWAEVLVKYPSPDLADWEKNIILESIEEHEPQRFRLEETEAAEEAA